MSKPSATRIRLPRDQRRTQLIDVALDVFAEHGFAHATMDDIAERAGVSKPVLYQHFHNKRELFFTLLDHQFDELRHRVTTAMQAVDPTSDTADEQVAYQAVRAVFEYHAEPRGLYRIMFDTTTQHSEDLEVRKARFLSELIEFVSPYILENSILDPAGSKFITRGIASSVLFMATRWAEEYRGEHPDQPVIPLEQAVDHTCRFVAHGAIGFDLSNNPSA